MTVQTDSFEKQLYAFRNQELQNLYGQFKKIHSGIIHSIGTAHQIFSIALKITNFLTEENELKRSWFQKLSKCSFSLEHSEGPLCNCTFEPIITLSKNNKQQFDIKIHEINPKTDDTRKIAADVDRLMRQAFGFVFPIEYHEKNIIHPDTFGLVGRYQEKAVTLLFATHVRLKRNVEVLHFTLIVRDAEYPSIQAIKLFQNESSRIKNKYPKLDYLTLYTLEGNDHAIKLYEKLNFIQTGRNEKGFKGKPTVFFIKKVSQKCCSDPTYEEVDHAREIAKKA